MVNNRKNQLTAIHQKLIFLLVLVLAIGLRFYRLQDVPGILNRDEAALAYNAKLLLETGKDEWGERWPIQFKSFGDYKLPGYILTLLPTFRVFGLSDLSVRIPSAVAGVVNVLLVTFLAQKAFSEQKDKATVRLITLFCMAVTPFAVFYSRMAWEANLALTFFLSSMLLLLQTKVSVSKAVLGLILYLFAIFTYNTPLLLFPLLLFAILIVHFKEKRRWFILAGSITAIFFTGLLTLHSVSTQKGSITIFNNETIIANYPSYRLQFPSSLQSLLGNKYVYWGSLIGEKYIQSWLPYFLVERGGQHPWQNIPQLAHLFLLQYVFALIGTGILVTENFKLLRSSFKKKKFQYIESSDKWKLIFLFWLIVSPLPSVITVDAPHATRSLFFLMMLVVACCYAITTLALRMPNKKNQIVYLGTIVSLLLLSSARYTINYHHYWPKQYPKELMVGLDEVVQQVSKVEEPMAVIDPEGYAYITLSWYKKLPAIEFFNTIQRHDPDQAGLHYGFQVSNFTFYKHEQDIKEEKIILFQATNSAWQMKKL